MNAFWKAPGANAALTSGDCRTKCPFCSAICWPAVTAVPSATGVEVKPLPRRFITELGASRLVITSQDTRPARADVPSDFSAMPIATPTAKSNARLPTTARPAVVRNASTTFGPAAPLIQLPIPTRIAATGSTATGSMIDLPRF